MNKMQRYQDLRVMVFGLGKSGSAAAMLLHSIGAVVTVIEGKGEEACPEAKELSALGIDLQFNVQDAAQVSLFNQASGLEPTLSAEKAIAFDLMVKNPGIPYHHPIVMETTKRGIPIITEVEVAFPLVDGPLIGITGSNGKTTTAMWVGDMLQRANEAHQVCGNIGIPLSKAVQEQHPAGSKFVVELSSFQLKGTSSFCPDVGCLLNIQPAHLDYHETMADYQQSKLNMFKRMSAAQYAVLNADDAVCRAAGEVMESCVVWFSATRELTQGIWIDGAGDIVWRKPKSLVKAPNERLQPAVKLMSAQAIHLPGQHNVENALAAAAIGLLADIPITSVIASLQQFAGAEHRIEYVKELNKASYYNDSKSTNPAATKAALAAFPQPIVWIAGGLDRDLDWTELLSFVQDHVHAAVFYGETKRKLAEFAQLAGVQIIREIEGEVTAEVMRNVVNQASKLARPGDVVLFSPACASWDMFESYEARGSLYKQLVNEL